MDSIEKQLEKLLRVQVKNINQAEKISMLSIKEGMKKRGYRKRVPSMPRKPKRVEQEEDEELRSLIQASLKKQLLSIDQSKQVKKLYEKQTKQISKLQLRRQYGLEYYLKKIKKEVKNKEMRKEGEDILARKHSMYMNMTTEELRREGMSEGKVDKWVKEQEKKLAQDIATRQRDLEKERRKRFKTDARRREWIGRQVIKSRIRARELEHVRELPHRDIRNIVADMEQVNIHEPALMANAVRDIEDHQGLDAALFDLGVGQEAAEVIRILDDLRDEERQILDEAEEEMDEMMNIDQLRDFYQTALAAREERGLGKGGGKYVDYIKRVKKVYPNLSQKDAVGGIKFAYGHGKPCKTRSEAAKEGAKKNPWIIHLKKKLPGLKKKYPNKTHKEIMGMVSETYKKKGGTATQKLKNYHVSQSSKRIKRSAKLGNRGIRLKAGNYVSGGRKRKLTQWDRHLHKLGKLYPYFTYKQLMMIGKKTYKNPGAMRKIESMLN